MRRTSPIQRGYLACIRIVWVRHHDCNIVFYFNPHLCNDLCGGSLAVVIDLYSRAVIGWSMKATMATELVLDAMTMAVWRRRPKQPVIIHSDQGSQFGSDDFTRWCKDHQLVPSMSRRGNCYDNAVVESFFSSLKKERIKRRIFASRQEARSEVFDYIEGFYNRTRRHSHLGLLSPYEFEQLHTGS